MSQIREILDLEVADQILTPPSSPRMSWKFIRREGKRETSQGQSEDRRFIDGEIVSNSARIKHIMINATANGVKFMERGSDNLRVVVGAATIFGIRALESRGAGGAKIRNIRSSNGPVTRLSLSRGLERSLEGGPI